MLKLFYKLIDWCFETKKTDEIIDNKVYIPCSQVFYHNVEEKEVVSAK